MLEAKKIKAAGFCKNRWTSGVNVVLNTMVRGKIVKISGKNGRKGVEELLQGRGRVRKRMENRRGGGRR